MKAVIVKEFGGTDKLIYTDVEKPRPGEGEVLVNIKAAGVNPVDVAVRQGYMKHIKTVTPFIPGWDMAGVIEETGQGATRFKPGDEVYSYARRPVIHGGTYAEYIALPESIVAAKPVNISFEQAAGVPLVALTAFQSLFEAGKLFRDQKILILGASGGVGSFAVQFAKITGCEVYAVASSKREGYLRELKADYIIDYTKGNLDMAIKSALPDGAYFVFDCGSRDMTQKAYAWVKANGTLVSILNRVDEKLAEMYKVNFKYVFVEPDVPNLDVIRTWIESNEVKVHVSQVYDLKDVVKAHEQISTHHTQGKIVLRIS